MKRFYLTLAIAPLFVAGCLPLSKDLTVSRSQLDDESEKSAARTIGDITVYDNAADVVVQGVGLVTGLDGQGGATPPCDARTLLEERFKRDKIERPGEILDSRDNAIVIVTGIIKAGARRDELADVEITLPQGSKVKSLRGGILLPTPLSNYASQDDVRQYLEQNAVAPVSQGNRTLKGHDIAIAKGTIQASLRETVESSGGDAPMKKGYVWKGAKLLEGRPMYLVLNTDQQRFRVAEQVATRINETFNAGESSTSGASKVAMARHKDQVAVVVPARYRLNHPHFMRVVRAIPLDPPTEGGDYVRKYTEQLLNPETAPSAALRLEAMGNAGMPGLKAGLKSEFPVVRFCAAEALAYLGLPMCAETLAKLASEHPCLQAYCLTALAALDDAAGIMRLEELLSAKAPELRYGAFRALGEVDAKMDSVRGTLLGRGYWVHEVDPTGAPMVHLMKDGRAEVVIFGESPKLQAPFSLTAGPELTVTARDGDTLATVSRFSTRTGKAMHLQCTFHLTDILAKMAELDGTYADAADMIGKAADRKALLCPVSFDALPKAVPMHRLAEAARLDPFLKNEFEMLDEQEAAKTDIWKN